jgi:hypothetical protein
MSGRLKKNGVINVQNPVEKAVHEGRFEELSDSEDDERSGPLKKQKKVG